MARKPPEKMVKVLLTLPLWLHQAMQDIRTRDGVSLSQQARMSLSMWVKRCAKDPHGALGALNPRGMDVPSEPETAYTPAPVVPLGPEPDPSTHPAEWAAWSAKAGAQAIAQLAAGHWPTD